jgi:hypothetical protein
MFCSTSKYQSQKAVFKNVHAPDGFASKWCRAAENGLFWCALRNRTRV